MTTPDVAPPLTLLPPAPVPMKPHVAPVKTPPGYFKFFSYLRKFHRFTPRASSIHASNFPVGTFSPAQVFKAYQWPKLTVTKTVKIGILSLGGAYIPSDMTAFCAANNMPLPIVETITAGGATAVSDPNGADVENMLDAELVAASFWAATGLPANIVFCTGPNDDTGMPTVVNALVAAGCTVISCSWGSADSPGSGRNAMESALQAAAAAGVTFLCASGDNSADDSTSEPTCDYPSGSAYAFAVGGTNLKLNADGTILLESAWGDGAPGDEGGGGGYDPLTPQPTWQVGIVPEPHNGSVCRGSPDTSMVADPDTGWQMIANNSWQVVGGTSASTPATAGLVAACKAAGASFGLLGSLIYPNRATACSDITTGSNGFPAVVGWDPATGLGSPIGPGFAAALMGTAVVPPVTPPTGTAPPPVVQPPPVVIPPPVTQPPASGIGVVQFRQLLRWIQVILIESQGQLEPPVKSVIAGLPLSPQQLATVNAVIASVMASIGARRGLGSPGAVPKATYAAVSADDFAPLAAFFGGKS